MLRDCQSGDLDLQANSEAVGNAQAQRTLSHPDLSICRWESRVGQGFPDGCPSTRGDNVQPGEESKGNIKQTSFPISWARCLCQRWVGSKIAIMNTLEACATRAVVGTKRTSVPRVKERWLSVTVQRADWEDCTRNWWFRKKNPRPGFLLEEELYFFKSWPELRMACRLCLPLPSHSVAPELLQRDWASPCHLEGDFAREAYTQMFAGVFAYSKKGNPVGLICLQNNLAVTDSWKFRGPVDLGMLGEIVMWLISYRQQ